MTEAGKRTYKVEVDSTRCKECNYCCEVCAHGVFESSGLFNKAGYLYMVVKHEENCNGCMKCATTCPDFAITVELRYALPIPDSGL